MARVGSRNIARNTTLILGKWFSFQILRVSSESDLKLYRKIDSYRPPGQLGQFFANFRFIFGATQKLWHSRG